MNASSKNLYLVAAALAFGVTFADSIGLFSSFPIRGEATLITAVVAGLLLIMFRDYGRRTTSLRPLARVSRMPLPATCTVRTTRRLEAIVEHAA